MRAWRVVLVFLVIVGVSVLALGSPIRIGSVPSLERLVVVHLVATALRASGYDVQLLSYHGAHGAHDVREALLQGSIDLCIEYTGTVWMDLLSNSFSNESPQVVYSLLEEHDNQTYRLVWMEPIWCNSTFAVATSAAFSEEHNVSTLTEFGEYVASMSGEVRFGNTFRSLDLTDLQTSYGFELTPDSLLHIDHPAALLTQVATGDLVAWTIMGTDPAVAVNDWVLLSDEKNVFPPHDLAVCVRADALDVHPGLEAVLLDVVGAFPHELIDARVEMTRLNAQVVVDGLTVEQVAISWFERPSTYAGFLAAATGCRYTFTGTINLSSSLLTSVKYAFKGQAPANSKVTVYLWAWKKKTGKAPYALCIVSKTVDVDAAGQYTGTIVFDYKKYTTAPYTGRIDAFFMCDAPPLCSFEINITP